ncbi:MAG: hypothetical protein ABIK28_02090 [Planctomycetota bacterium]
MKTLKRMPILALVLILSLAGNMAALVLLDKALHYREYVKQFESTFPNQGIRLVTGNDLRKAGLKDLGVFIGGGLPRHWSLPADFPYPLANLSGAEESIATTWKRFDETVIASNASFVLINAGFCDIYVAIQQRMDVQTVLDKNMELTQKMVAKAKAHGVLPILSTLTPVRSRFLLPHTRWLDYSSKNKATENTAFRMYNQKLADYCRAEGVALIDFHKALCNEDDELSRAFALPDGEHIHLAGYLHLTPFLASELKRILSEDNKQ